jgi:hypothetical protein
MGSRPSLSFTRIHPYKLETTIVDGRVVVDDVKEGRNSVLAGLGHFDVELLNKSEIFTRPGPNFVDFAEDIYLLPFWVRSRTHQHIVEPSGEVDAAKTPLSLLSKTQLAGSLVCILVHPRLYPAVHSKSLRVTASILADARDPKPRPPREAKLTFFEVALMFDEDADIDISYELAINVVGTKEIKLSSFDFLAVLREPR